VKIWRMALGCLDVVGQHSARERRRPRIQPRVLSRSESGGSLRGFKAVSGFSAFAYGLFSSLKASNHLPAAALRVCLVQRVKTPPTLREQVKSVLFVLDEKKRTNRFSQEGVPRSGRIDPRLEQRKFKSALSDRGQDDLPIDCPPCLIGAGRWGSIDE
jgi:hypothetical protein